MTGAPVGAAADPVESTVGTGSVFALGCSLLTIIVIIVGVAIFMIRQVT